MPNHVENSAQADPPSQSHLEVSKRAERDLRKIDAKQRRLLRQAMDGLVRIPPPGNLDIKKIELRPQFLRLRVGDWRIIYRPLSDAEMRMLVMRRGTLSGPTGFLIERIVDRQHLERAVERLEFGELQ